MELALFSGRVAFCRQPEVSAAASLMCEVTRLEDVCCTLEVSHTIVYLQLATVRYQYL